MTTAAVGLALTGLDAESGLADLTDLARRRQRVDAWQAPAYKISKISTCTVVHRLHKCDTMVSNVSKL